MKKGDFVKIRTDLVTGEEYGAVKMLADMEDMKGSVGMVTAVDFAENTVKVGDWWWSGDMVLPNVAGEDWLNDYVIREIDKAIVSLRRVIDILA